MTTNELFANETTVTNGNGKSHAGTAQLTNLAVTLGNQIMEFVNNGMASEDPTTVEIFQKLLSDSMKDHSAMDKLIAESNVLTDTDVSFITELDEPTIDGMLKSQQSKRSRAKSKRMTRDNYLAMLTGAVAENLIRKATGKAKSAVRRTAGIVEFSEEALEKLAADQDALRREIRNVQSKKSIMKSKEGFDEESEGWQALLVAEAALKAIRIEGAGTPTRDPLRGQLTELLADHAPWDEFKTKKDLIEWLEAIERLLVVEPPTASDDETPPESDETASI